LLFLLGLIVISSLLLIDALTIVFVLVILYLVIILIIVFHQKNNQKKESTTSSDFRTNEKWSSIRNEMQNLESNMVKSQDNKQRKAMMARINYLENELRRLEWSLTEQSIDSMLDEQKRNPKRAESAKRNSKGSKQFDRAKDESDYLDRIIKDITAILKNEMPESVPCVLHSFANELRAIYHSIKTGNPKSRVLPDYWITWTLVTNITFESANRPDLSKYASKEFRAKISDLDKALVNWKRNQHHSEINETKSDISVETPDVSSPSSDHSNEI